MLPIQFPKNQAELRCYADYAKFNCRRSVFDLLFANNLLCYEIYEGQNMRCVCNYKGPKDLNEVICNIWLWNESLGYWYHVKQDPLYLKIQRILWENLLIERGEQERDRASGCFRIRQALRNICDDPINIIIMGLCAIFFIKLLIEYDPRLARYT